MMRIAKHFPALLSAMMAAVSAHCLAQMTSAATQMASQEHEPMAMHVHAEMTAGRGEVPQAGTQQWAKDALDKSSRHREYVPVTHDGRTVNTFVVYPETSGKAPVVVLIHEIFGLSDWMKLQADELAAQGYIVLAPDLLSGVGPGGDGKTGGGTDALFATTGTTDPVVKAISTITPEQVTADLDAVADYGKKLPSASSTLFVAGFCWGGGKAFLYATHRGDLSAAFVFYGPPPPADAMAKITAPVYGFYGGNDARIGATIPQAVTDMKASGKVYEPVTYDGAGHGFMRAGQAPGARAEDVKAYQDGTARLLREMKAHSGPAASSGKKLSRAMRPASPKAAARGMDCSAVHTAI